MNELVWYYIHSSYKSSKCDMSPPPSEYGCASSLFTSCQMGQDCIAIGHVVDQKARTWTIDHCCSGTNTSINKMSLSLPLSLSENRITELTNRNMFSVSLPLLSNMCYCLLIVRINGEKSTVCFILGSAHEHSHLPTWVTWRPVWACLLLT